MAIVIGVLRRSPRLATLGLVAVAADVTLPRLVGFAAARTPAK